MDLSAPISSIMTTDVESVSPSQKLLDIKHIYERRSFHHHIPVVEGGQLVGMVSLIDFMRNIQNATLDDNESVYHNLSVKDIMTEHPITVTPETSIEDVARVLSKGEFHALIVRNNGNIAGIVTTADLLNYFLENS